MLGAGEAESVITIPKPLFPVNVNRTWEIRMPTYPSVRAENRGGAKNYEPQGPTNLSVDTGCFPHPLTLYCTSIGWIAQQAQVQNAVQTKEQMQRAS